MPVVHQPLERDIQVVKDSIGVKIDASLVISQDLGDNDRFLPRRASVGVLIDVDEIVLVSMDFG